MKLLIIGGGAGGAAAAARARRLDERAEIIVIERGAYVSYASCGLPYYAGDVITERDKLIIYPVEGLKNRFALDIRTHSAVRHVDCHGKTVAIEDLAGGARHRESYDYLILAPGAEPIIPPIEGAHLPAVHTVRNLPDIDRIKARLDSGEVRKVAVIGGGYIGLEMAENIHARGITVDIIEMQDQVLPVCDPEMAAILHRHIIEQGVRLHLGERVAALTAASGAGCVVHTASGVDYSTDMVVVSAGVKPEISLAREAGLKIGRQGIQVDRRMRTSDESIFAVGDAVETEDPVTGVSRPVPLAGPAAKQARVAVNTIFGIHDEYAGTLGTAIVKIFALALGMTGATEKQLKSAGKPFAKVYTQHPDHASYYPGASPLIIKLMYDPRGGRVLGAQVVGKSGVDKRIDLLATAIRHSLTVKDLAELELSYAPPFGSTKDPVNLTGLAALNSVQGLVHFTHWDCLSGGEFLLDVRTEAEFAKGAAAGAVNIPLDDLRDRLSELSRDREITVYCGMGYRSYIACRIMSQNGFSACTISGGYAMYRNFKDAGMLKFA